ncbi:MAG: hypothetical protein MUF48_02655 [Pirellulaceae bacterium]|nr:hypothetical protein [Pirellulaceae bacterium]
MSCLVKWEDVHPSKAAPQDIQFAVRSHDLFVLPRFIQIGQPSLELLVETDDRGRDIVRRKSIKPRRCVPLPARGVAAE